MASFRSLSLHLQPPPSPSPLYLLRTRTQTPSKLTHTKFRFQQPHFKKLLIFASSNQPSSWEKEREETRWLREEQRWLREEQRWVRQESRWNSERELLLEEIASLKLRIQGLDRQGSSSGIRSVIEVIKEKPSDLNLIVENGSGSNSTMLLESEVVKEMVESVKDIEVSESIGGEKMKKKGIASLRVGSEGEDVRSMQEELQKLGFYSGEEDMEYSSFSSGTLRAVKTWQASIDVAEDGIMTAELLETLLMENGIDDTKLKSIANSANGAPVASVTKISETKNVVKESGAKEVDESYHKVFLLGENRWEEPSRLRGRDKPIAGTKCVPCRGEGRVMCTECDGSGEPNIEEQFMEWVDDRMKCPYCEGLGYTICDVCDGKTVIPT
ncbi:hypothetical protein GIB67_028977 [Kingdonia uniflora]|uniref:Peptidoglycan binding-like domain-containing protein n=1 Tax=Kingdonia uniflora TaxID=39325 RepID=A0A7J7LBW5_9MAGN|nr:hypothetical protein GIB67_028977 [Kingdonia uniflora]